MPKFPFSLFKHRSKPLPGTTGLPQPIPYDTLTDPVHDSGSAYLLDEGFPSSVSIANKEAEYLPQRVMSDQPQLNPQGEWIEQQHLWPLSNTQEALAWLSDTLQDKAKRRTLFERRGHDAQSLIDRLNHYLLDPEFREAAEPWLLKHTAIALRKLCEVSALYPTCYVLSGVQDISSKGGGGFCDILQGRFRGRLICLKVVRLYQKSKIEDLLKNHAREAILWSQLDHPNIVPFDGIFYFEKREQICLVSPWMNNGDIVDYLEKVPDAPREPFIYGIANGLRYLHDQNIVHGDLKGRNILIDDHQNACLADFGLSTIVTDETLGFSRTTTGTSGLTTRWASPELLEDDARPSRESDVWAFGCVCYEVLTGLTPFTGCSDIKALSKLMKGELPARLDNTTLDSSRHFNQMLCELVGKCWSIETKQRPRCPEILQHLEKGPGPRSGSPTAWRNPDHPRLTLKTLATVIMAFSTSTSRLERHPGPRTGSLTTWSGSPTARRNPDRPRLTLKTLATVIMAFSAPTSRLEKHPGPRTGSLTTWSGSPITRRNSRHPRLRLKTIVIAVVFLLRVGRRGN